MNLSELIGRTGNGDCKGKRLPKGGLEDSRVNSTIEMFLEALVKFFGNRLISVVLYGSAVFEDLAPGYGDLDFLAVLDGELSEHEQHNLIDFRKPFRSRQATIFARMLEGAFLPRKMLDPANSGRAFWWGTTGERPWKHNELGWCALAVIRQCGRVIYGQDIRCEIPEPTRELLLEGVRHFCDSAVAYAKPGELHSLDWLLTAARMLLWLKEDRFSSKSEAADWAYLHANGLWRQLLPQAKQLRLHPDESDKPEWKEWLDDLQSPIKEAIKEVNAELPLR